MESALTRTSFREQPFCNTTVGNYHLLRQLGSGSFAKVYLAKHLYLHSLTALKLLTLPSVSSDEWRHFQFEAHILAHLRHPHIVRVLDFGWASDMPYLVMEYAPGGTLQQVFPLGKALHISSILPTVLQIASALQFIHNHGVIHCDVKPANVLLGPDDVVWLSDFGIAMTLNSASAELYGRESVPGTPSYIAPERMYGYALPASDQYALAVMVYQWLCGTCPFEGSVHEVCFKQVSTPPSPLREHVPSISPAVERVVLKALAKEPQKRFANVQDFAFALMQASWSEA